jgi:hypothetical protein
MMRFVLCAALAVCSVVQAEEFPFVSGAVEFCPVATVGEDPLYWDLGQGQGLVFGSASLQSFRQDACFSRRLQRAIFPGVFADGLPAGQAACIDEC